MPICLETGIRGAESAMKKTWVTVVNVIIMIAMLTFVVLYSNFENKNTTQRQINENASVIGSESILFVGSKLRQVWCSRVQKLYGFYAKKIFFVHQAQSENPVTKVAGFLLCMIHFKSSVFITIFIQKTARVNCFFTSKKSSTLPE